MTSRKSLLLSISLHAILTLVLLAPQAPPTDPPRPAPLQIAIVEGPLSPSTGAVASPSGPPAPSRAASRLESFFPKLRVGGDGALKTSDRQAADDVGDRWKDDWEFGADIESLARKSGRGGFYSEIYRRIDSHLLFDDLLVEYGRFGEVMMKFAVTHDGRLLESGMRAQALDRVLKVRVVWALRAALKDPFAPTLRPRPPGPYWIGARFFFSKDSFCMATSGSSAEMLTFCRTTNERPPADNVFAEVASLKPEIVEAQVGPYRADGGQREPRIQIGLALSMQKLADHSRKAYRKETKFDPFFREKQDPAWNL